MLGAQASGYKKPRSAQRSAKNVGASEGIQSVEELKEGGHYIVGESAEMIS